MYGAILAHRLLVRLVPEPDDWNGSTGIFGVWERWSAAIAFDVRIGSVGLLCALTAPLVWGLLAYHGYLIWAGMTTNETAKWGALREYMAEGCVWIGRRSVVYSNGDDQTNGDDAMKPAVAHDSETSSRWPTDIDQVVLRTNDGKPPFLPVHGSRAVPDGEGSWERCWHLSGVDNLYDLGFWDNLMDVFYPDWQ